MGITQNHKGYQAVGERRSSCCNPAFLATALAVLSAGFGLGWQGHSLLNGAANPSSLNAPAAPPVCLNAPQPPCAPAIPRFIVPSQEAIKDMPAAGQVQLCANMLPHFVEGGACNDFAKHIHQKKEDKE